MHDLHLQADSLAGMQGEALLFTELSFKVSAGECLQIVGANGCGKTTLLKILVGLLAPWRGDVLWCGTVLKHIQPEFYAQLIYVGHKLGIKRDLTVVENLAQSLLPISNNQQAIDKALQHVQLSHCADTVCAHLSRGQCQRIALARLLLSAAKVWVLDEPFSGLDSEFILLLQQWMLRHINCGGLIIMSTHQAISLPDLTAETLHMLTPTHAEQLDVIR